MEKIRGSEPGEDAGDINKKSRGEILEVVGKKCNMQGKERVATEKYSRCWVWLRNFDERL